MTVSSTNFPSSFATERAPSAFACKFTFKLAGCISRRVVHSDCSGRAYSYAYAYRRCSRHKPICFFAGNRHRSISDGSNFDIFCERDSDGGTNRSICAPAQSWHRLYGHGFTYLYRCSDSRQVYSLSGVPHYQHSKPGIFFCQCFNDGKHKCVFIRAHRALFELAVLSRDCCLPGFPVTCPGERNQERRAQTLWLRRVGRFRHFVVCLRLRRWLNDNHSPAARHTQRKLHNHSERSGKESSCANCFSHADRELKFIFRS